MTSLPIDDLLRFHMETGQAAEVDFQAMMDTAREQEPGPEPAMPPS